MKKHIQIDYDWFESWRELNEDEQHLVQEAINSAKKAYAPYSKFHVGATALLDNQTVIHGNNQENIAYPSGICAERVALFYAGANFPSQQVQTLVVYAEGDLIEPDECVSPCGSCRQVIAESEARQKNPIRIILVSQSGKTWIFKTIADLLIFPFGVK